MIKRLFLLCAVCLTLTACGRRIRTNPPTQTGVAATAEAATGTALEPAPVVESDPLGDEIERLLDELDANNAAADSEIDQLPAP
jgi:hypothetical protein